MPSSPYDIMAEGADGGEDAAAGKPASPGTPSTGTYTREMRRANILLVVLFLGGGAAVYGLSLRKGPTEASAEQKVAETAIDSALLRLTQKPPGTPGDRKAGGLTRDLAESFVTEIRQRQVPLSDLAKDPFVFVAPPQSAAAMSIGRTTAATKGPAAAATPEQQDRDRMMAALAKLRLQSVMMGQGGGGTALISNNLLSVGQDIEGFTIKSITPKAVVLSWREEEFVLTMPQ